MKRPRSLRSDSDPKGSDSPPWPMNDLSKKDGVDYRVRRVVYRLKTYDARRPEPDIKTVVELKNRPLVPNIIPVALDQQVRLQKDALHGKIFTFNDDKAFPLLSSCDGTFPADAQPSFGHNAGDEYSYWTDVNEEISAFIADYGLTDDIKPYVTSKKDFPPAYKADNISDHYFEHELQRQGCGDIDLVLREFKTTRADLTEDIIIDHIYERREMYEQANRPRYDHQRVKDPHQGMWYDTRTEAGLAVRDAYFLHKASETYDDDDTL